MTMEFITKNKRVLSMAIIGLLAIVAMLYMAFSAPSVGDAVGTSMSMKLLTVVVGFSAWFIFLRISDAFSCIDFRHAFDRIENEAMASAVYFGLRMVGAGVFLGSVLG